jgi:Type II secretion system protein C
MKNRWLYHSLAAAIIVSLWVPTARNLWQGRTGPGPAIEPLPVKTSSVQPAALPPVEQYAVVSGRNLFGGSGENAPPEQKTLLESMPQADKNLGLWLVGTVVTDDPKLNLAFIEDSRTRKQKSYRAGDTVGNARIKNVLRNNVVIATARGDEVLIMKPQEERPGRVPEPQEGRATTSARRQARATPAVSDAKMARSGGSDTSGAARGTSSSGNENPIARGLSQPSAGETAQQETAPGTGSEGRTATRRRQTPGDNHFLKALEQARQQGAQQQGNGNAPGSPPQNEPFSELLRQQ